MLSLNILREKESGILVSRFNKLILFSVLLFLFSCVQEMKTKAVIPTFIIGEAQGFSPFENLKIEYSKNKHKWGFQEDWYTLTVSDTQKRIVRMDFHSSYNYKAYFYPVLKDGEVLLCLERGIGRGTMVREEFLDIYRLENGKLKQVFTKKVGWFGENPYNDELAPYYHELMWRFLDTNNDCVAELFMWSKNRSIHRANIYGWSEKGKDFKLVEKDYEEFRQ